jgi:dTDP-4-dehydrorhamnose reductase
VLITGASGLVGRAAVARFTAAGDDVTGLDHEQLDISDETAIRRACQDIQPEALINCAAWTDVDGCESDPDRAMQANAVGPELLALAGRERDALLVTISTDYVFDGEKEGFYTQRDQPNPRSVYAATKLEGERRAQLAWARTVVVRSGYIFGRGGRNFLSTMISLARAGKTLSAIDDSYGTPTYAPDLAARLYELTRVDLPGIYHVVNDGDGASFADFARAAFAEAGLDPSEVRTVGFASLDRPAPRPRNSRLRCLLSPAIGLDPLRFWQDALREFVRDQSTAATG